MVWLSGKINSIINKFLYIFGLVFVHNFFWTNNSIWFTTRSNLFDYLIFNNSSFKFRFKSSWLNSVKMSWALCLVNDSLFFWSYSSSFKMILFTHLNESSASLNWLFYIQIKLKQTFVGNPNIFIISIHLFF